MPDGETREWLGSDKQYVKALFDTYLHPYMEDGVDFWWLDWQQWLNDKKIGDLSNTWWCNYIFFSDMERQGTKRPMLYTRSMQMGQYLPILRTHSTKDAALNKEPWAFNQMTRERLKRVVDGRYALVPYIYTMVRKNYETGISLCRPLYYDYPEDKEAYDYRNEYMFGDQMLIALVTGSVSTDDGFARLKVWLPRGEWLEYETGTMLKGGQGLERSFTLDEYPVYVKAGSILPYYGYVDNLNGTKQPVIVRVYPGADRDEFSLYEDK